jgi:hypothetical protein
MSQVADDAQRTDVQRFCGDCMAENPQVFVVHDDLWCWHIPGPNLLCLLCEEKRLGHGFTPGDFKRVPANDWVFDTFETDRHPGDAVTRSCCCSIEMTGVFAL